MSKPSARAEHGKFSLMSKQLPVTTGVIHLTEVSGACWISEPERLILVSDENGIFVVEDAARQLLSGEVRKLRQVVPQDAGGAKIRFDDLEDAAWDPEGRMLYLLASHSLKRNGKRETDRRLLMRLPVAADGTLGAAVRSEGLGQAVERDSPYLSQAGQRTTSQAGLNMEGLEWSREEGGSLLVGLRSPTLTSTAKREDKLQEDAILLKLPRVPSLFDPPAATAVLAEAPAKKEGTYVGWVEKGKAEDRLAPLWPLNLGGMGIRGLAAEGKRGLWILAGLAMDPNHAIGAPPWDVWYLAKPDEQPKRVSLPTRGALEFPEAICRLELDGEPYLLLVEDSSEKSGYLLLPCPKRD